MKIIKILRVYNNHQEKKYQSNISLVINFFNIKSTFIIYEHLIF